MIKIKIKSWLFIVCLLFVLFVLIFSLDFYFLHRLSVQEKRIIQIKQANKYTDFLETAQKSHFNLSFLFNISRKIEQIHPAFINQNPHHLSIRRKLVKSFKPVPFEHVEDVWRLAISWPLDNEIYPENVDDSMGQLLHALQVAGIQKTFNSQRGTQLKLVLRLDGGQQVLWKPGWYTRDTKIEGPVYSGKDRHNSEIISFYLGAIFNLRWTPIVAGRRINMKEVYEKADTVLKETMLIKDEQYCVYGKCHYCNISELICGDKISHLAEGAVLFLIPGQLQKHISPWQRTYKPHKKALWESDSHYCGPLRKKFSLERLLDMIDVAIFDYLIQNGDRHRHESRNNRLVLVDNGKGFGNPHIDHLDILAPLYQCCMIRKSTYDRMLLFTGGSLTDTLKELTKEDPLDPLLTDEHYIAMEKRLLTVFVTVQLCQDKFGKEIFK
ncbi:glycosaminoglycan xylosylkinase homolog isoform X2 [Culicoides brevitarsis]|uniref:glycosaminoglycan xylosylkinase homolog isoform X2 n=1 Tax=Culicoides brevitarsis TaxID=469753 RepID=UPI00307B2115